MIKFTDGLRMLFYVCLPVVIGTFVMITVSYLSFAKYHNYKMQFYTLNQRSEIVNTIHNNLKLYDLCRMKQAQLKSDKIKSFEVKWKCIQLALRISHSFDSATHYFNLDKSSQQTIEQISNHDDRAIISQATKLQIEQVLAVLDEQTTNLKNKLNIK